MGHSRRWHTGTIISLSDGAHKSKRECFHILLSGVVPSHRPGDALGKVFRQILLASQRLVSARQSVGVSNGTMLGRLAPTIMSRSEEWRPALRGDSRPRCTLRNAWIGREQVSGHSKVLSPNRILFCDPAGFTRPKFQADGQNSCSYCIRPSSTEFHS